jgi:ParB-like chromosome segregation protein Spo0J
MPSWRDVLKIHPACELFPAMSADELKALGEDIEKNGLLEKIKLISKPVYEEVKVQGDGSTIGHRGYEHTLVDGRNRLAALEGIGRDAFSSSGEPSHHYFENIDGHGDRDIIAYVISANIHRRHLTAEQKRELIGKLIKADPTKSDRQIAKQVGASPTTAGKVRSDLEAKDDVSKVDTRTDTKGRQQPVHKPKNVSVKPPPPPTAAQRVEEKIRQAGIADKKKHGGLSLVRIMHEVVAGADREELIALANHSAPERHVPARQWCQSRNIDWEPQSEKPSPAAKTPEAAAEERKALYACQDNAPDTDNDDLPDLPPHTIGDPSRRKRSIDEVLANTIKVIEGSIEVSVPCWREVDRIPEFFCRIRKLIDKLEAEAACDEAASQDDGVNVGEAAE